MQFNKTFTEKWRETAVSKYKNNFHISPIMSPVDVMKACPCHLLNLTSFTLITGGKHPNILILKSTTGQKRTCNKIVHWLSNLSIMSREMFAGEPSKPSWKKKGKKIIFCSFFFWGGGGGLTGKSIYSRQFVHRHLIPLKCKTRNKKSLLSCLVSCQCCFVF